MSLRDPPETGKPAARRGLLIRDALLILGMLCIPVPGIVALGVMESLGMVDLTVFLAALIAHYSGIVLLIARTLLKPPKTLWERAKL